MWSSTPSLQKLTKENQKPQFGPPLIQNREQQILYSGHHPSLVHLQERPAAGKGRSFSLPSFEMDRETGTSDATCGSIEDGGDSKEAAIAEIFPSENRQECDEEGEHRSGVHFQASAGLALPLQTQKSSQA